MQPTPLWKQVLSAGLVYLLTCLPAFSASARRAQQTAHVDPLAGVQPAAPGGAEKVDDQSGEDVTAPVSAEAFENRPLTFERNAGQSDPEVQFLARAKDATYFITETGFVTSMVVPEREEPSEHENVPFFPKERRARRISAVHMRLAGATPGTARAGSEAQHRTQYMLGSTEETTRVEARHFERLRVDGVYRGVDMVYRADGPTLEYDFVVAPGADPDQIRLEFAGATSTKIAETGDLLLRTDAGPLRHRKPVIYQERDGTRELVDGAFLAHGDGTFGFRIGDYDRTRELVVDPPVDASMSTYLGGTGNDNITEIVGLPDDSVLVFGESNAVTALPGLGTQQLAGGLDAFIQHYRPTWPQSEGGADQPAYNEEVWELVESAVIGSSGDDGFTSANLGITDAIDEAVAAASADPAQRGQTLAAVAMIVFAGIVGAVFQFGLNASGQNGGGFGCAAEFPVLAFIGLAAILATCYFLGTGLTPNVIKAFAVILAGAIAWNLVVGGFFNGSVPTNQPGYGQFDGRDGYLRMGRVAAGLLTWAPAILIGTLGLDAITGIGINPLTGRIFLLGFFGALLAWGSIFGIAAAQSFTIPNNRFYGLMFSFTFALTASILIDRWLPIVALGNVFTAALALKAGSLLALFNVSGGGIFDEPSPAPDSLVAFVVKMVGTMAVITSVIAFGGRGGDTNVSSLLCFGGVMFVGGDTSVARNEDLSYPVEGAPGGLSDLWIGRLIVGAIGVALLPVLFFRWGGPAQDRFQSMHHDPWGFLLLCGFSRGGGFPFTDRAIQTDYPGGESSGILVKLVWPKITAVTSAGSFTARFLSPGKIFTIFGHLIGFHDPYQPPLEEDGTIACKVGIWRYVIVDENDNELDACVFFSSSGQANVMASWQLIPGEKYYLRIYMGEVYSPLYPITIVTACPDWFLFNQGDPNGPNVIATNASQGGILGPFTAGDVGVAFFEGGGPLETPPADAEVNPPVANPLVLTNVLTATPLIPGASLDSQDGRAQTTGVPVETLYVGATAGFAGLYQANFVVPDGLPAGPVQLSLTVDGQTTPAGIIYVE